MGECSAILDIFLRRRKAVCGNPPNAKNGLADFRQSNCSAREQCSSYAKNAELESGIRITGKTNFIVGSVFNASSSLALRGCHVLTCVFHKKKAGDPPGLPAFLLSVSFRLERNLQTCNNTETIVIACGIGSCNRSVVVFSTEHRSSKCHTSTQVVRTAKYPAFSCVF